jgi:hypothetical protein
MRILFSYLVLLAFALQIGSRIYVMVNYQINKEYIAENLCEKKDEPESCCEGSCQLAKELVKVEESETQGPFNPESTKKEKTEESPLFFTSISFYLSQNTSSNTYTPLLSTKPVKGFYFDTFHPPTA